MAEYIPTNTTFVNPYNFIDLIKALEKKFKYKDQKAKGALTGWLECTLETKTPIFIPNTTSVQEDKEGKKFSDVFEKRTTPKTPEENPEVTNSYDFYSYTNLAGQKNPEEPVPVIPGSEIRGMIRSAFEAVTNSCLSTIDDEQKLYKRVQTPAKAGRLVFEKNQWKIIECGKYRLPKSWLNKKRPPILIHGKKYHEGQPVFIKINYKNFKVLEISQQPGRDLKPGFLHVGEYNENKNYEAVFIHRKDKRSRQMIEKPLNQEQAPAILGNLLENLLLYRDKQNKTEGHNHYLHFQLDENALKSVVRLAQRCTEQKMTVAEFTRRLQHDFKNVFDYLKGALIYFVSRRSMHGERYYLSPAAIGREVFYNKLTDLIGSFTSCTKLDHLCEACALFGIAGKEDAAASRVRFTDAHVQGAYQFDQSQTLKELASPKLSATEFYLKKPSNTDLWNYDYAVNWKNAKFGLANYTPEIRGRKFYWHHTNPPNAYITEEDIKNNPDIVSDRNVHVRPLESGTFSFKVYFNNITKDELHKLLWVLEIGDEDSHAHKIGMGKPLGLGSVQIRVKAIKKRVVRLTNSTVQYALEKDEKPVYAEIKKNFSNSKIVKTFLKITNFDEAYNNVEYPNNEHGEAHYEWFMANKVIHPSATGTRPIIDQILPELSSHNQCLKKYRSSKAFDATQLRFETKLMTVDALLDMVRTEKLLLKSIFEDEERIIKEMEDEEHAQKNLEEQEIRFIESLMMGIPLPPLYMLVWKDNTWRVVDGLKRLKALEHFIVQREDRFWGRLSGLKLLSQFDDYVYSKLPANIQRKIRETEFTVHIIEKGTSQDLILSLQKRINPHRDKED